MSSIKLVKTAKYLPSHVVSNDDLKQFVDTDDQWIRTRTGIQNRRFAKDESNLDLATAVGKKLLENIDESDIVAVIVATFTSDYATPTMACLLQKNLELPQSIMAFDFNAACSGFVYGLNLAKGILLQNPGKKVMVIGSEKISRFMDFTDRNTCILFGDGAGGALVELDQNGEDTFIFETIGNDESILCDSSTNNFLTMNGKEVFVFAVNAVAHAIQSTLKKAGVTADDVDHFVCHQANLRIISHVYKKLGIAEEKFFVNLDKYGNTSSASIAIALDEMVDSGKLKKGDKVMLVGFGAGLTWGSSLINW